MSNIADPNVNRQGSVTTSLGNVDYSITALSGISQLLVPAATRPRKRLIIKNGAAPCGVNLLGGTAVLGGAGTVTLQAYEGMVFTGDDCPQGAITVIGTIANYITAFTGI